jgi:hypothetical protein
MGSPAARLRAPNERRETRSQLHADSLGCSVSTITDTDGSFEEPKQFLAIEAASGERPSPRLVGEWRGARAFDVVAIGSPHIDDP